MKRVAATLVLTQLSIAFMLLTIRSLSIQPGLPLQTAAVSAQTAPQAPEPVDYQKVGQIVQEQIASLPSPKNGLDGMNGTNGANGSDAIVDYNRLQGVIELEVSKLQPPAPVVPPQIEQRENPVNGKTEWRCAGDTLWTSLQSSPILKDGCL